MIENNYKIITNKRSFIVDQKQLSNIFKTNRYKRKRLIFLLNKLPDFVMANDVFSILKIPILNTKVIKSPGTKIDVDKDKKIINIYQSNSKDWILFSSGEVKDWTFNFDGIETTYPNQYNSPKHNFFGLTGCLNFYNYNFNNVFFNINGGGCEDSLNVVRSSGNIEKIKILDSYSDGLDVDFSDLNINFINIKQAGNDCIDFSGGNYYINNLNVFKCADKGVSVGEKSKLNLIDANVTLSKIGFSIKDLSILSAKSIHSSTFQTCLELLQKKQEFGGSIANIDSIQCNSKIITDQNSFIVFNKQ
tara:strand:- start:827 stop:1738 length:912 start_codon:yes stop_codon:yes gene_type:complete